MQDRHTARLTFVLLRTALFLLLAIGLFVAPSERLKAQDPPPNNPATGTPTLVGPLVVGEVLRVDTSSIADLDGLTNPGFTYTWYADGGLLRVLTAVNEYKISPDDAGNTLFVQVHFEDDLGNRESIEVQSPSLIAPVAPESPWNLSASLGDPGELDLSWSAPDCDHFSCWISLNNMNGVGDGGSDITGYTVQWKLASGSWGVASHVSEADVTTTTYTVTGLNASETYTVRVLARNAVGRGIPSTELTVSGTDINIGPVISGLSLPTFFETNPRDVTTYVATDPENDSITWSLSGVDARFFRIDNGVLWFDTAGDFEDPRDAGRNNAYNLNVHATDGANKALFRVVVVVSEVDEAPVISGPSAKKVQANAGTLVHTYSAKDPEGKTFTWSLAGDDASHFTLEQGTLSFSSPPDLNAPLDADQDNNYQVTVQANVESTLGSRALGELEVTVSVVARIQPPRTISGGGGGGGGGGPPPVPVPSDKDFDWNVTRDIEELDKGNDIPTGMWSDGHTLWIIENASGADSVFAYELEGGDRQEDREFELDRRNRFSHGIWSNGETAWIADSGQDRIFAYVLESGERDEAREFELAERNRDPRGIWADAEMLYVLDSVKDALFVYDFETGELLTEHALDKLNNSPRGIWSDGVTLWVSDDGAKRLFAYEFEADALKRNEDLEFTFRSLLKAGNGSPRGIWSDGDVMYVVDERDDKVYTYNIPDAIIARLGSLSLHEVELEEFSPNRFEYADSVAYDLAATTVAAVATQETAKVMIEPADADGDPENGHQVTLGSETAITVTVTSADGSRTKAYVVQVSKPPCLSGLAEDLLSEVTFVGGSVSELEACARSFDVSAFYHYADGVWTAFFLDAPEFLRQSFGNLFAEGLPPDTSLIAKREPTPIAASSAGGQE